ncbi:hypothetical protein Taro_002823 [Colocasia esculenta]|uniref:Uncharacterized protein n=1 Tax=Colocasia esculenta TaxID=4460 RepID=A0A843TLY7_COLES|nr:hypothetical protein [Colocasia esculenta]
MPSSSSDCNSVQALSAACRQEGEMEQYLEEKKASQKRPAAPFQRQERKKATFQSPQRPVASGSGQYYKFCLIKVSFVGQSASTSADADQGIWLRVVGMVFLLMMASRGEMSLGVRIRVSSRPLHPRVLYFLHRHQ